MGTPHGVPPWSPHPCSSRSTAPRGAAARAQHPSLPARSCPRAAGSGAGGDHGSCVPSPRPMAAAQSAQPRALHLCCPLAHTGCWWLSPRAGKGRHPKAHQGWEQAPRVVAPSTPLPPSLLRPRASAGSPHSLSLVGSGCWDWVPPITLAQLPGLPQRVPTELPPVTAAGVTPQCPGSARSARWSTRRTA